MTDGDDCRVAVDESGIRESEGEGELLSAVKRGGGEVACRGGDEGEDSSDSPSLSAEELESSIVIT